MTTKPHGRLTITDGTYPSTQRNHFLKIAVHHCLVPCNSVSRHYLMLFAADFSLQKNDNCTLWQQKSCRTMFGIYEFTIWNLEYNSMPLFSTSRGFPKIKGGQEYSLFWKIVTLVLELSEFRNYFHIIFYIYVSKRIKMFRQSATLVGKLWSTEM